MESNLDRISFLGVDCLFSQQSQAKVKSPGPLEHFQNKWGQAYAVGMIGPSDSLHLTMARFLSWDPTKKDSESCMFID